MMTIAEFENGLKDINRRSIAVINRHYVFDKRTKNLMAVDSDDERIFVSNHSYQEGNLRDVYEKILHDYINELEKVVMGL